MYILFGNYFLINKMEEDINRKEEENFILTDHKKDIIHNCSKLIFEENKESFIKGNFGGIEIKIAYYIKNHINMYYISFDIESNYFNTFFNRYIEEWEKDIISPCHFVIQKLPTILIFNLLEEGQVILTGKRMGGVIASSLAFYLLYYGNSFEKNYGNAFLKEREKCLGVVTFGAPSFLTNLTIGKEKEELTDYFYHIKEKYDCIPAIIDYINKTHLSYQDVLAIFGKDKFSDEDKRKIINFSEKNHLDDSKYLRDSIKKIRKVPFGIFFMMESSDEKSLIFQTKNTFNEFYYSIALNSEKISDLTIYKNLPTTIQFKKESLAYLENKNYQLDFIKIVRRNNELKPQENTMKGIIKFKLSPFDNNIITPDIISHISLNINKKETKIKRDQIYYDNDNITAYIDDLNENINEVKIVINFGGEIKVKKIINIQGSGPTRNMLKDNIEKLFLFPFFKLIEIFYASINNKKEYKKLKEENFGENFEDLKILKQFESQINAINELLFLSRPDILGYAENSFFQEFEKNILTEELKNKLEEMFNNYYAKAKQLQASQKIKCLNSEDGSLAKKYYFPSTFPGKTKKLFMCERKNFDSDNFILDKFDYPYIQIFFIEELVKNSLINLEKKLNAIITEELKDKDENECKKYFNGKIKDLYDEIIIKNIYFILILIISSNENGDEIKFNHDIDITKINSMFLYPFIWLRPYGKKRAKYEKDFKKQYSKNKIEEINIKNIFYKTKIKKIIDSNNVVFDKGEEFRNTDQDKENKINNFSEYSEKRKFGKEYYNSFLKLLNYNSSDFQEDIEISIYENLKEENQNAKDNFKSIKEIMNDLIVDEESKKGFLALVRQSYLLGKLRTNIVSIFIL